jgi:hypothetical protein
MQDQKKGQTPARDLKAERLAEALRSNLAKRKALARAKKAGSAQSHDATNASPPSKLADEQGKDPS